MIDTDSLKVIGVSSRLRLLNHSQTAKSSVAAAKNCHAAEGAQTYEPVTK
jgi:hypothetical protein